MASTPIRRPPRGLLLVSLASVAAGMPVACGQDGETRPTFRPVKVVRPFAPITDFEIKSVVEVIDQVNPAETVLGVTIRGHARAYPVNMLTGPRREIVNDTLGGTPIASTW